MQAAVTVLYTNSGFTPATIHLTVGQTVIFKNTTDTDMWVASNPHPAHTDYSGFDEGRGQMRDSEYAFAFTRRGTWGYHNHLSPDRGGQVVVE